MIMEATLGILPIQDASQFNSICLHLEMRLTIVLSLYQFNPERVGDAVCASLFLYCPCLL
jgi:hypothetical protein